MKTNVSTGANFILSYQLILFVFKCHSLSVTPMVVLFCFPFQILKNIRKIYVSLLIYFVHLQKVFSSYIMQILFKIILSIVLIVNQNKTYMCIYINMLICMCVFCFYLIFEISSMTENVSPLSFLNCIIYYFTYFPINIMIEIFVIAKYGTVLYAWCIFLIYPWVVH